MILTVLQEASSVLSRMPWTGAGRIGRTETEVHRINMEQTQNKQRMVIMVRYNVRHYRKERSWSEKRERKVKCGGLE